MKHPSLGSCNGRWVSTDLREPSENKKEHYIDLKGGKRKRAAMTACPPSSFQKIDPCQRSPRFSMRARVSSSPKNAIAFLGEVDGNHFIWDEGGNPFSISNFQRLIHVGNYVENSKTSG